MNLSHLPIHEHRHEGCYLTAIPHRNLNLALRLPRVDEGVVSRGDLDPVHTDDLGVNHEP